MGSSTTIGDRVRAPERLEALGRRQAAADGPGAPPRRRAGEFPGHSPLLRGAYEFARAAHAGQRLATDGAPAIHHPLAVAALLHEAGFGEEVVAAGLLHDTVEDSEARIEDLGERFGEKVARIVTSVTEPARIESYELRKAAHREQITAGGVEAAAVFAADKLVSTRNLRGALAARGEAAVDADLANPLERKLDHYRASLADLERDAPSLPFLGPLRSELEQLELQRRSAAQRGG